MRGLWGEKGPVLVEELKEDAKVEKEEAATSISIHYFGVYQGQADRPFVHIKEAMDNENEKLLAIRNVWNENGGIKVLSFFHDSSSYVAATGEAIMLDFSGLKNLTNERRGLFYGGIKEWDRNVLINMGNY